MSDYNARQGSEPGSVFYGFISDRFASYYSRVIAAAASEAPYVLDGLMHHESAVETHEHATDTAGAESTESADSASGSTESVSTESGATEAPADVVSPVVTTDEPVQTIEAPDGAATASSETPA